MSVLCWRLTLQLVADVRAIFSFYGFCLCHYCYHHHEEVPDWEEEFAEGKIKTPGKKYCLIYLEFFSRLLGMISSPLTSLWCRAKEKGSGGRWSQEKNRALWSRGFGIWIPLYWVKTHWWLAKKTNQLISLQKAVNLEGRPKSWPWGWARTRQYSGAQKQPSHGQDASATSCVQSLCFDPQGPDPREGHLKA